MILEDVCIQRDRGVGSGCHDMKCLRYRWLSLPFHPDENFILPMPRTTRTSSKRSDHTATREGSTREGSTAVAAAAAASGVAALEAAVLLVARPSEMADTTDDRSAKAGRGPESIKSGATGGNSTPTKTPISERRQSRDSQTRLHRQLIAEPG